jgi:putative FmdB family regulatory protein
VPTYEYRCPDGHDFEQFVQKMSQAQGELPCPVCGKPSARRMSAGGGLVFKGSGFYITDYGKDGKKDQRAAAEAAAKPKSESGTSGSGAAATAPASSDSGATPKQTEGKGDAAPAKAAAPASPAKPAAPVEGKSPPRKQQDGGKD